MGALNELHDLLAYSNDITLKDLDKCKWYNILKKIRILGRLEVLALVDGLIHELLNKYDNNQGKLN